MSENTVVDVAVTDRFWEKVDLRGPDECWEWLAAKVYNGYGQFSVGVKTKRAHRIAWEITNGPIPRGMQVLHRCDNPGCVNPAHLWLGTSRDNITDCIRKGRQPRGSMISHAKLHEAEIPVIRQQLSAGESQSAVGRAFGVHEQTIRDIVQGKTWTHVLDQKEGD